MISYAHNDSDSNEEAELSLLDAQPSYTQRRTSDHKSSQSSSQQQRDACRQSFMICLLFVLIILSAAHLMLQFHFHPVRSTVGAVTDQHSVDSTAQTSLQPIPTPHEAAAVPSADLPSAVATCPDCPICAPPAACPVCTPPTVCPACQPCSAPKATPAADCKSSSLLPNLKSNFMPSANHTHASIVLVCPHLHDRDFYRARHFAADDSPEERLKKSKEGDLLADAAGMVGGLAATKVSLSRQSQSVYFNASLQSHPYAAAPSYSSGAPDWNRLDLSGWKVLDTFGWASFNTWWPIYEVDVDTEAGELIVPLVVEVPDSTKAGMFWMVLLETTPLLPAFQLLVHNRRIECDVNYPDGSTITQLASLVNHGEVRDGKKHPPTLNLLCPFRPMWRPTSVTIRITTPEEELVMPDPGNLLKNVSMLFGKWSGEVTMALCHSFERRVEVAMVVQPVFNGHLNEFMDWADYHRRIGVDVIYVPEREGKMFFQDDLDPTSVHAGRLRLAIEQDFIRYSLMPILTSAFAGSVVDQEFCNYLNIIRSKRRAKWLLTLDMDEYLVWYDEPKPYNRACDNSLWCPSPLVDWLEAHQLTAHGLLIITNDMVVGSTNSPIPTDMILPQDVWRHSKWLDPKMDASRICPFEPQTDAMKKRVLAFQQEQKKKALAAPGANITNADGVLCELPYSVQHVYTHDVSSIYSRTAARGLYRPGYTIQARGNAWPSTRDTVWAHWDQMRSKHFGDMRGRVHLKMDRNGKVWPRPNNTAYWHSNEHPPIYDSNVADVMQFINLPPRTTDQHINGNLFAKRRN